MGMWRKTLIYLGLVEDEEFDSYGYDDFEFEEEAPKRQPLRKAQVAERSRRTERAERPDRRDAVVRAIPSPSLGNVHKLSPRNFDTHAKELGDKFRNGAVVIMDLKETSKDTASRLKNFASGLVYGLEGHMEKVGNDVYLLAPRGVQVSAEEQQRYLEESGLFNEA